VPPSQLIAHIHAAQLSSSILAKVWLFAPSRSMPSETS
jgi:hypothetical protein